MEYDRQIEISKKKEYLVCKSNQIIQKSRYELSVPEQRAIAYICSLIKPITAVDRADNKPFQLEYEFNILEYANICGLASESGRMYEDTKALLKGLISKVMWLTLPDGTETTVNWVSKVWTNKRSGKAKIRLDEDMVPYLFDLQEKFTAYGLYNILRMKSQYSIRLYELLKSYEWQKTKVFEVLELKKILMVEDIKSYSNFNLFNTKVLKIAIEEINTHTDIDVTMETITKGRKVVQVRFCISSKSPMARYIASMD